MPIPHPQLQIQLNNAAKEVSPEFEVRFRAMFGGAGAYAYEQMFASLSNVGLALKLPAQAQEELLEVRGAKRLQYDDSMSPSKQYIVVPDNICADTKQLGVWVGKSLEYVSSLSPKKRKKS